MVSKTSKLLTDVSGKRVGPNFKKRAQKKAVITSRRKLEIVPTSFLFVVTADVFFFLF